MEFISGTKDFKFENTCVTLGKFDGIHLGHRKLLEELKRCEKRGLKSVMFTFDLHPFNLFSVGGAELIYTQEEKRRILEDFGPQVMISYPFTSQTAAMRPGDFVRDVLCGQLGARVIVVGNDFRFGRSREGDAALLQRLSSEYGYRLVVCDKVRLGGEVVSSTLIRSLIAEGRLEEAAQMLGRPYSVCGSVAHGKALGRRLSFPTANIIASKDKLLPPDGVYFTAGRFVGAGEHKNLPESSDENACAIPGKTYYGLCNIGTNPTVNRDSGDCPARTVENFFIGEHFDIYGMELELKLLRYHRAEQVFSGTSELSAQIARDVEAARRYFAQPGGFRVQEEADMRAGRTQ